MQQAEMDTEHLVEQGGPVVDESVDSDPEQVADASAASEGDEGEEGEQPEEDQEGESQPHKPYSKLKERMHQLSEESKRAKLEAQQYQEELKRIQEEVAQIRSRDPLQQHMRQEPKLEDFDYDEGKFKQALGQWISHGQQIQQQAYMQEQRRMAQQARLHSTRATGASKYPDWEQVVGNPQVPSLQKIAPDAYDTMIESDVSADIAYRLSKDPAKVWAMQQLDSRAQIRAILELEQQVRASPSPRPPQTEPASIPTGGMTPVAKDPDKMSVKEWRAWRSKQRAQRGQR